MHNLFAIRGNIQSRYHVRLLSAFPIFSLCIVMSLVSHQQLRCGFHWNEFIMLLLRAGLWSLDLNLHSLVKVGKSISDCIVEAKTISDHLSTVGEPVPERDLVLHVLCGLGFNYNDFVTSIKLRMQPVSFDELHSKLMS